MLQRQDSHAEAYLKISMIQQQQSDGPLHDGLAAYGLGCGSFCNEGCKWFHTGWKVSNTTSVRKNWYPKGTWADHEAHHVEAPERHAERACFVHVYSNSVGILV